MAGVPEPVFAADPGGWSDPYWRRTTSANSRVVNGVPPPTLNTRPAARSSVSTSTLASTTSWMLT